MESIPNIEIKINGITYKGFIDNDSDDIFSDEQLADCSEFTDCSIFDSSDTSTFWNTRIGNLVKEKGTITITYLEQTIQI